MDNIREWISDNLRYIILILALIIVIIVGAAGIKAIRSLGGKRDKASEQTTEATTESTTEAADTAASSLVQNDAKVLTMMTSYYTAKTNKDIESLKKLDPSINEEEEKQNLENTYVESYSNIKTYSKNGPEEGSCVVYVCYDGKVQDIDTLVPSLTQFYLKTDADGNYYIADPDGDQAAVDFIEQTRATTEVQDLIDRVNKNCEAAKASDPVLKEFMEKYGTSQSSSSESAQKETEAESVPEETMYANDACNVRSEPSTASQDTVIGGLTYGETVEVIGKEGDWYKINFNGQEAYVSAEFVSTESEFFGTDESVEEAEEEDVDTYDESSDASV